MKYVVKLITILSCCLLYCNYSHAQKHMHVWNGGTCTTFEVNAIDSITFGDNVISNNDGDTTPSIIGTWKEISHSYVYANGLTSEDEESVYIYEFSADKVVMSSVISSNKITSDYTYNQSTGELTISRLGIKAKVTELTATTMTTVATLEGVQTTTTHYVKVTDGSNTDGGNENADSSTTSPYGTWTVAIFYGSKIEVNGPFTLESNGSYSGGISPIGSGTWVTAPETLVNEDKSLKRYDADYYFVFTTSDGTEYFVDLQLPGTSINATMSIFNIKDGSLYGLLGSLALVR